MRPPASLLRATRRPVLPARLLSTIPPHQPPQATPASRRTYLSSALLVTAGLASGLALSLFVPRPRLLSLIFPQGTAVPHPADSPEGKKETQRLEKELQGLQAVTALRAEQVDFVEDTSTEVEKQKRVGRRAKYTEHRPYAATPAGPHSLSGYALRGPGKFAVPPLVFATRDKTEQVFFMHLGSGLCGHEGVVHGGLLGTILDESLARTALLALPSQIGVTATLNIAYKKPTFADQFVCIKTKLVEVKGRKAWAKGVVEDLEGNVLVEAEGLFVEPRMAKFLKSSSVKEALK